MNRTVLVVAKAPLPGRAKTRLVPPLSAAQAAELQRALLLDTLDSCRAEGVEPAVLHAEPDEGPLREALGPGITLVLQEGGGLGDALRLAMRRHLEHGPVAIVSSDVPGLPPGSLGRAFDALEEGADVVLGPALDGGYWLVAMRAFDDAPFRDVPWSTPAVLAVTLERCRGVGLATKLLEPWRDVDTLTDVTALARACPDGARRTRLIVRKLAAEHDLGAETTPALAESALLSSSPWRAVVHDRLVGTGGHETEYTYLAVPRAVFVAAVTDARELLLVRQYRHPVREWTLEVPAGSVRDGEQSVEAAARELAEEVGGRARAWRHLTTFYSSSAHISLRSDAFLAIGVEVGDAAPEEGEDVTLVRLPLAEAVIRARAGGFTEGQTALTILLAAERLEEDAAPTTPDRREEHVWPGRS